MVLLVFARLVPSGCYLHLIINFSVRINTIYNEWICFSVSPHQSHMCINCSYILFCINGDWMTENKQGLKGTGGRKYHVLCKTHYNNFKCIKTWKWCSESRSYNVKMGAQSPYINYNSLVCKVKRHFLSFWDANKRGKKLLDQNIYSYSRTQRPKCVQNLYPISPLSYSSSS